MSHRTPYFAASLRYAGALALCGSLAACVETVPSDVVEAIESLDRDLLQLRAAEVAPSEYAAFAHRWITLRTRVEAEEDTIRWPWESNELEHALRQLRAEGALTVARLTAQLEEERQAAERQLA
ncbi:MAG TPA: hypothetical protein VJL88_13745, partial [Nitrospira sp.]|nr:hypothetical protein [Nitrospira sp.]